mmetsp:Transcript_34644/g.83667  ORF Transcript_34644/g.83667 Transcript_34644/m.83667 type:complete len:577 (+) Transcript_34644:79-1809(+)
MAASSPLPVTSLKKDDRVEIFFLKDCYGGNNGPAADGDPWCPTTGPTFALKFPKVMLTEGWLPALVLNDWDASKYNPLQRQTWPKVQIVEHQFWTSKKNSMIDMRLEPQEHHRLVKNIDPHHVRMYCGMPPALSLFIVRWGGHCSVDPTVEGDGGWGESGASVSDRYIANFLDQLHDTVGVGSAAQGGGYEIWSAFVQNTREVGVLGNYAPGVHCAMRGVHKAGFYYLWPVEWQDSSDPSFAGYVEGQALIELMKSFEGEGIYTRFPYNSHLYSVIAAKTWQAQLSVFPELHIPTTTKMSRVQILSDPRRAAQVAMDSLETLRKAKANWAGAGPAEKGDGQPITSGMVKLGWSWEGTSVWKFEGVDQLAYQLSHGLLQAGLFGEAVMIQEYVTFDFEMRFFVIGDIALVSGDAGECISPAHITYNRWNRIDAEGKPREFEKLTRNRILSEIWSQDNVALDNAHKTGSQIVTKILYWLRTECAEPPTVLRVDFMVKRTGPGTARVMLGELTELGACCLGWDEGPRLVNDAVIRSCFNAKPDMPVPLAAYSKTAPTGHRFGHAPATGRKGYKGQANGY